MKILSLSSLKTGLMATSLTLAATSCVDNDKLCKNAENNAAQYLTGEEYFQAQSKGKYIFSSIAAANECVNYWDSLNTEYKVKRAYQEGAQMVKDSARYGEGYPAVEYPNAMPINNIIEVDENYHGYSEVDDLIEELQREVAKNTDGQTLEKLITEQPNINDYVKNLETNVMPSKNGFVKLHYWNQLLCAGKQRKAFNDGANAERAKLNK